VNRHFDADIWGNWTTLHSLICHDHLARRALINVTATLHVATTVSMGSFKVIIVGSGLAGNLLANGLINNNVEVEVYERLAITAKREGYQIRLGENALKGFRACLTDAQKNLIISKFGRASGSFASAPILYDRNFRPLLDLNKFPNYEKSAPISRKILRDLLAAPVENAGRLFYDKSFKSYKVINPGTPHEKIRVIFDDGTSSDCDILVAADGAHSKVRRG
jgi:2-polyprenyl-6-methoxyphenol hydroxylase-like FAD-dependent oxidoreductase